MYCTIQNRCEMSKNPTEETYTELDIAYDFFNKHLFESRLPPCLITLQREKRTYGYFSKKRFVNKDGEHIDELAMNPSYFGIRSIPETLSTFVHEMTHVEQEYFGKPSRNGYHNKEWGRLMERVGLCPSNTGQEGGKRTGQQMSHYIVKGGAFDVACKQLMSEEFTLSWYDRFPPVNPSTFLFTPLEIDLDDEEDGEQDLEQDDEQDDDVAISPTLLSFPTGSVNKSNRDKYRCPVCANQVWGKPNMKLKCGEDSCNDAVMEVSE